MLLLTASMHAQTAPAFAPAVDGAALGVYAGIHRALVDAAYAVDSRGITTETECGRYESGTESGIVIGAVGELPLTHMLGVHASLELAMRDASMKYPCVDPAGTRMPDGSVETAITEFQSETSYSLLTLQLGATLRPLSLPFIVAIGPSLSLLTQADYAAREVIVTPTEASFVAGGQERRIGSGEFASGGVSVALAGAIWYEARLGGRWWLVPRIAGSIALTDEVAAAGIRATGLQATLGISYRFPPRVPEASPIEAGAEPAK
jgi:hypothetical protein